MKYIGIFSLCITVTLAGCSRSDQPEYIPTQKEWEYAIEALGETSLGGCHHHMDPEGAKYSVDFLVKRGKWYAVVMSIRNRNEGIVQSYVGFLGDGHTRYAKTDTTRILTGEFASRYADLVASDSCWTLANSSQDWTEESLEKLWDRSIRDTLFGVPAITHSGINLDLKRHQEARDSISD